jgi:hypothetical protein
MPGSLSVPNIFLGNSPDPISTLDANFAAVTSYINIRELTFGLFAARPSAGTSGRWYYATDTGALYADNGSSWIQVAAPLAGLLSAAGTLVGSANDADYTTTSATYVDVDATNLKATIAVATGAKFLLVLATCVPFGGIIADGAAHIQILAAGSAVATCAFFSNPSRTPQPGPLTTVGVVANPTPGSQTLALQFRGDGANAMTIYNPSLDGLAAASDFRQRARLLYVITN